MPRVGFFIFLGMCIACVLPARAQAPVRGIYVCVDAKGHRRTSDRPIVQCNDTEQKVLNRNGTVRTKIGPSLSAVQREDLENKERAQAQLQARAAQEKRHNDKLLARYPSLAVYDAERTQALSKMDADVARTRQRVQSLTQQRAQIDVTLNGYKADVDKVPPQLRQQSADLERQQREQQRLLTQQELQVREAQAHFEQQRLRLQPLWDNLPK